MKVKEFNFERNELGNVLTIDAQDLDDDDFYILCKEVNGFILNEEPFVIFNSKDYLVIPYNILKNTIINVIGSGK